MTVEHKDSMERNMSWLATIIKHDEYIIRKLVKEGILTEYEGHKIKSYSTHIYKFKIKKKRDKSRSRDDYEFRHDYESTQDDEFKDFLLHIFFTKPDSAFDKLVSILNERPSTRELALHLDPTAAAHVGSYAAVQGSTQQIGRAHV